MKWISVKDKLPDDDRSVLMCDEEDQDTMPVIGWYDAEGPPIGFYVFHCNMRVHPTHWMYLPGPINDRKV